MEAGLPRQRVCSCLSRRSCCWSRRCPPRSTPRPSPLPPVRCRRPRPGRWRRRRRGRRRGPVAGRPTHRRRAARPGPGGRGGRAARSPRGPRRHRRRPAPERQGRRPDPSLPDPSAGGVDSPGHPTSGSVSVPLRGPRTRRPGAARRPGPGCRGRRARHRHRGQRRPRRPVVASADLSGEWNFTDSYATHLHGRADRRERPGRRAGRGRPRRGPGRPQGGRGRRRHHPRPGPGGHATRRRRPRPPQPAHPQRLARRPGRRPGHRTPHRGGRAALGRWHHRGRRQRQRGRRGRRPRPRPLRGDRRRGRPRCAVPSWSSRGPDFAGRAKPDLVAPGVGLVGLRAPGSTIDLANPEARWRPLLPGSGTSMSTAVVAGAAALVAAAHPEWGPDRVKAALTRTAAGTLDLGAALGAATVPPANADLFPLRPAGRAGTPKDPEPLHGLGWRSGGADGLRWAPTAGLPRPTAGAADTSLDRPSLAERALAADQPSIKSCRPAVAGPDLGGQALGGRRAPAAGWAALQWSWGGLLAAALDGPGSGLGGAVDSVARSWAARSWAQRGWGPGTWRPGPGRPGAGPARLGGEAAGPPGAGPASTGRPGAGPRAAGRPPPGRRPAGRGPDDRRTERPAGPPRPGGDDAKGG